MKQKDNTMRATPETDDAQFGTGRVSVDFARRLERERDEARELAHELRDALTGMEEYYRQHIIQGRLFLQVHAALTKAKEVLGEA